jgi:hypothetical protein
MRRSKEAIEDRIGTACEHFAYPWGKASAAAERSARGLFRTSALEAWRTNRAGKFDRHRLGRTPVFRSDAAFFFRAKARGQLDGERLAYRALRRGPWGGVSLQSSAEVAAVATARRRSYRVAHVTTVDLTLRFLLLEQLRRCAMRASRSPPSARRAWVEDPRAEGIEHVPWNATRAWDSAADVRAFGELLTILRRGAVRRRTPTTKPGLMGRVAARWRGSRRS